MAINWFNRAIERWQNWDEKFGLGGWLSSAGHTCDSCGAWVPASLAGDECYDCRWAAIQRRNREFWESAKIVTYTATMSYTYDRLIHGDTEGPDSD